MPEKNIAKYQNIIEMLNQGKKHSDIIAELGCSYSTIQAAKLYQEQVRLNSQTSLMQGSIKIINGELEKIQEQKKRIQETDLKAETAFKNGIYGEYFRLKYIVLESTIKFLYYCYKHQPAPDQTEIFQIITQIEAEFHQKICDPDEFTEWRLLRNKFIHEGIEITRSIGDRSLAFFNSVLMRLNQILEKFIQPKFDYNGTQLVKADYDVLKILEMTFEEKIPKNNPNGFSSLFGFTENDGYITTLAISTKNIKILQDFNQKLEGLKELFIHQNQLEALANWLRLFKNTPVMYDKRVKLYLANTPISPVKDKINTPVESLNTNVNRRMNKRAELSVSLRGIPPNGIKSNQIFDSQLFLREMSSIFEMHHEGTPQYKTRISLLSQDYFINGLKDLIRDCSTKYAKLEIKEIAELISVSDKNELIIKTLKEMLVNEEIKGLFFNSTQSIVFEINSPK